MVNLILPTSCRCCLEEEKDMVFVFDTLDEFDEKIYKLISLCGQITIEESDIFSKFICGNCLNSIAIAARFIKKCLETAEVLQELSVEIQKLETSGIAVEDADEALPNADAIMTSEGFLDIKESVELEEAMENVKLLEIIDDTGRRKLIKVVEEEIIKAEDILDYDSSIIFQPEMAAIIEEPENERHLSYSEIEQKCHDSRSGLVNLGNATDHNTRLVKSTTKQLNYRCLVCGAGFVFPKNLLKHMESHETVKCSCCAQIFHDLDELKTHIISVHPVAGGTKPSSTSRKQGHECTYCGKLLVSRSALTVHVRVHTGERPFMCKFKPCGKRFATVGSLEVHERRHMGVKPYWCTICGRGFVESSNLAVHQRSHTKEKPHRCTYCDRGFTRVFLLQIHLRTHTGEKPYTCQECGRGFSQQGDLAAHKRIHSGERPHMCDICGKGFIKSSGLAQHKKSHKHLVGTVGDDAD